MSKNVKKGIMLFVVFIMICMPIFSLEGTVVSVSGKVELQTPSGWAPLKTGDIVESGIVISTGFRSQATIQVAGSNIIVNQLSRLTLEQLTETNDSHNSEVFLDLGTISADVKGAENKRVGFVVNTPVATASVRGTAFEMGINSLRVTSGVVGFGGKSGKEVPVSGGNASTISSSGSATSPITNKMSESLGTSVEAASAVSSVSSAASSSATTPATPAQSAPQQTFSSVTVTFEN